MSKKSEKAEVKRETANGEHKLKPGELQERIFEAIKQERFAQDCKMGPVQMRPMKLDTWTHNIKSLAELAYIKALYGQRHESLTYILKVAAEAVAALECRIYCEAEEALPALHEALEELDLTDQAFSYRGAIEGHPPAPPSKGDDKETADPVGAESAA